MTSVKEKIHLSKKKKKSRAILDRLKDCKATTVRKDGNFWSSKKPEEADGTNPCLYVYAIWTVTFCV